jgi:thiamine biosynthesis lipoprotein
MIAVGTRYVMATLLRVEAEADASCDPAAVRDEIFDEVQRLETMLSRFLPQSDVSRVNGAAGIAPAIVAPEAYAAIETALDFARATGGAFSPVDGGDFRDFVLDRARRSVFLPSSKSSLDLGGIGKGFALDRALDKVRDTPGFERLFVDFGGQLLFWSRSGRAYPAAAAIEDPRETSATLASFEVRRNCSVSTSSQAERPGHLVDRRSGLPADGALSATVLAPSAAEAEAWSTALFVDGEDVLRTLADRRDVEAYYFPARATTAALRNTSAKAVPAGRRSACACTSSK